MCPLTVRTRPRASGGSSDEQLVSARPALRLVVQDPTTGRLGDDLDEDGVVALGAIGSDVLGADRLELAVLVDGSNVDAVHPRRRVPVGLPLDPRFVGTRNGEVTGLPGALVDGDLHRLDATHRRPGDAGNRCRSGGDTTAVLGDVDAVMALGRWSSIKALREYPRLGEALFGQIRAQMAASQVLMYDAFLAE